MRELWLIERKELQETQANDSWMLCLSVSILLFVVVVVRKVQKAFAGNEVASLESEGDQMAVAMRSSGL